MRLPTLVQVVSDLHYDTVPQPLRKIIRPTVERGCKVLLIAGDTGNPLSSYYREFLHGCSREFDHVLFTAGNHEYHGEKEPVYKQAMGMRDPSTQLASLNKLNALALARPAHFAWLLENVVANSPKQSEWRADLGWSDLYMQNIANEYSNVHFLQRGDVSINGIGFLGCTLWSDIDPRQAAHISKYMGDYKRIVASPLGCAPRSNTDLQQSSRSTPFRKAAQLCLTEPAFPEKPTDEVYLPLTPDMVRRFHSRDLEWLKCRLVDHYNRDIPTVVMTHHSPVFDSRMYRFDNHVNVSSAYYTDLRYMFSSVAAPKAWISGHTHLNGVRQIVATQHISNCRGIGPDGCYGYEPGLTISIE